MASLPKHIIMMVEKGNLVKAITALSEEKNISMDEAKQHIDAYEDSLKTKQHSNVQSIAKKQGLDIDIDSLEQAKVSSRVEIQQSPAELRQDNTEADAKKLLTQGLDNHLDHIGYKKPLVPYWVKRLLVLVLAFAVVGVAIGWLIF